MGMLPDEEGFVLWLFVHLSPKAIVKHTIIPSFGKGLIVICPLSLTHYVSAIPIEVAFKIYNWASQSFQHSLARSNY